MSMDFGAYAQFIVSAYGVTVLVLGGTIAWVWRAWRAAKAKLAVLERVQEKGEAVFRPDPRPNQEAKT